MLQFSSALILNQIHCGCEERGFSDFSRGRFPQRQSPGFLQQLSSGGIGLTYPWAAGNPQTESSLLPWQNHLRLQSVLTGMDSTLLRNYVGPYGALEGLGQDGSMATRTTGSSFITSRPTNNDELRNFLSVGAGAPVATLSRDAGRQATLKSGNKPSRKKRTSKKLDISYEDYKLNTTRELTLPSDEDNLSPYQRLLRQQILLFSVQVDDIQCSAQGRNKPILLGQVGVVCRHCAKIPPGLRPCGAVYFPGKLSGLYQASQNMAVNHFKTNCRSIPDATRESLFVLKDQKSSVIGGGKHFWANGARVSGVCETAEGLLRFVTKEPSQSSQPPSTATGKGEVKEMPDEDDTTKGKQKAEDCAEPQKSEDDGNSATTTE